MNLASPAKTTLWDSLKADFKDLFPDDIFRTWFEPLNCVEHTEQELVLEVPNEFAMIWIEDNYLDLIKKRVHMATGEPMKVSLRSSQAQEQTNRLPEETKSAPAAAQLPKNRLEKKPAQVQEYTLNPRNTFESFVVGPGNQLAHAACIAVANAPARAYNPLFLYGDTGLGKTHLLHAIAHQVINLNPEARVAYISTEKFTNEFIRAIQENNLIKFRQRYRSMDVLLIDDIQFLSGKERIQEEFFHTFNELFESQKQVVLASDRPAGEIARLEARLVSRFQWGLVTDIQIPDYETRMAILTNKALSLKLDLPQAIMDFLAKHVSRNVRRLEGALTRVAGYAALTKGSLSVAVVENLLQDILQEEALNQVTIDKVQNKVADYFHLRLADMVSRRRPANIAFPRQIAMYLSRILTSNSLQEIGDAFGRRDHGTVIHACKSVENMMEQDESVKRNVEYLQKQITQ